MAAAYGCMPIGSALWHQHHTKNANDAGTAAAICELVDNCLAVDDRANASRINLQLSVQVPGSGAKVALLCDNGAGVARIADLAMMFKSKEGQEQAVQHSISGMYSFGAKFAIMVAAKSMAVLYNRHHGPPGDNGDAPLREELLLLSNIASPETISTAVLDLTGIPEGDADAIQHWLTQRKDSAIDATGRHHTHQQDGQQWLQAMHAFGRLPGFRAERSDEVLGVYNLYTFVRDQFMQRMREVGGRYDTGTLWLLPDPSETLKAWAEKDGHEVADLLVSRYCFGLSRILPQDLEVRPGRLYREVALTPTLVIGKARLKPADLELRGINKQLRSYRSAVVPLHLPSEAAAAAAVAAADGGLVDVDAAVAAAAARPFAHMVVTMGPQQDMQWTRLTVEGVPKVTAVHYVRAMEASRLLHTCSEQDGSMLQAKLGSSLTWARVFRNRGVLEHIGMEPYSLVDVGEGRTIELTHDDMKECWLMTKKADNEGIKCLLLGAGLQVVLFLPPGNGVLVPNKTKTKGKRTPQQVPWTIELLIRKQLTELVLKYPPPPVIDKYRALLHQPVARSRRIISQAQQRMQGAGGSNAAASASLALAQQQAQVAVDCERQLQQMREQVSQDVSREPITLGWLMQLAERSSSAYEQAEGALAGADSSRADVSPANSGPGGPSSNNSSDEELPLRGGGKGGVASPRARSSTIPLAAAAAAAASRDTAPALPRNDPRPQRTQPASSQGAPKTPTTPCAAGSKRANPTSSSHGAPPGAADSSSTKRPRRQVNRYDPSQAAAGGGRGGRRAAAARRTPQLPLQQPAPLQPPAQQQPLLVQAVQQLQGVEGVLSQLAAAPGEPAAADSAQLLTAVQPHVQAFVSKWCVSMHGM